MSPAPVTTGVLALQGSFSEHISLLNTLTSSHNLTAIPVRTAAELAQCTGLIIPGGESTTISLLLQRGGLLEPVREFVRRAKAGTGSVWGTCAGMILLGKEVVGSKDGYEGLDGIDYKVVRNQWGRQLESSSHQLNITGIKDSPTPFNCIFIRAPVVHSLLPLSSPSSPPLQVLARVDRALLPTPTKASLSTGGSELGPDADVVMLRQGNLLASSFHPELTGDARVHQWWVEEMVIKGQN